MNTHGSHAPAAAVLSLLAAVALHPQAQAGTAVPDPAPAKQPVVEPSPSSSLWEVTVTPYGWLSSIDGQVSARGYTASTHVGLDDILQNMDMVMMMNVEARRGRWGGWIDGIYLNMTTDAETPGPLLDSLGIGSKTLMLEAALYYRLWDDPRGYLDLYAGARYNRMETDLSFHPSDDGIRQVAEDLSERIVGAIAAEVRDKAEAALSKAKAAAAQRAREALQNALDQDRPRPRTTPLADLRRLAAAEPRLESSLLRDRALRRAIDEVAAARVENDIAEIDVLKAGAAAAASTVQQAKARARSRAQQAVINAEKRLAQAIERTLKDAIPDEISQTGDWVDPFVGLRGRYNINDRLYVTAKADVGGFGAGSDLTWQAYGGLGWQLNRRWSSEIGYRYMSIDYGASNGFQYDLEMSGVVVSASLHF